jgi:multiple sugar transport system substrate-binding protein
MDVLETTMSGFRVMATRRRVLGGMAAGGAAMALAACGGTGNQGTGQAQLTAQPLELSYMPWDQNRPDLMPAREETFKLFTDKHPNIKVTTFTPGGDFMEKIKTVVAAGTPPDVADTHHVRVRDLGDAGTVQDLTRYLKRDPYPKEHLGWDPYAWQGKQFGVSWGLSSTAIFYNKALFDQAGLPIPADNWTWDQFLDASKRLLKRGADDSSTIWGGGDEGGRKIEEMHAMMADYGGGIMNEALTDVTITSPASLQAIEARVNWTKQAIHSAAGATGSQQSDYLGGKMGMLVIGSWFVSNVNASQLKGTGTWDVAPTPKGPKRRAGLAHENGIGLPTGIKHENESWALLRALTSPEGLVPFAKIGRIIPANKKVWDSAIPADGQPKRFKQAILDVWEEIALYTPWTPRQADVQAAWNETLDGVWQGKTPAREGADAFKQRMEGIIKSFKH